VVIDPSAFGIDGASVLCDEFGASAVFINPGQTYTFNLMKATGFYVLVPVGVSGIAFLGDRHQFVTLGETADSGCCGYGAGGCGGLFRGRGKLTHAVWVFAATGDSGFAGGEPSCAGLGFEFGDVHGGGDAGRQRNGSRADEFGDYGSGWPGWVVRDTLREISALFLTLRACQEITLPVYPGIPPFPGTPGGSPAAGQKPRPYVIPQWVMA
jgi:hypothetical protein